jgi:DNA-nicking Smr family endonuclease
MDKPKDPKHNIQHDNSFKEFIDESKDFKVLENTKVNPYENKSAHATNIVRSNNLKKPHNKIFITPHNVEFKLSEHLWRPEVNADDYLFYFQPGVQYKTIRKIRSGKIRIEATLDLHQMNKEQARIEFSNFIQDCYDHEYRCICIIHGKGIRSGSNKPILKNLINHWLYDVSVVLGFCSCPDNMGGTGAVLVLLQRCDN